ncbi:glycoside hydrolase family 18 protein [Trichoderma virens Gv29-8]|uniref:chitinase n=1 Tax=Hypocrea virens (strain Gv29-8 / FGSC 10586) TaxID=413071 RepID=G9N2E2_HYPVG|nr:glycoside hydrolase family 18 protein [Trichoderma virens Gv29-8]EHK19253.1 glycoside hydrolase family 18 protein [Trichoderma virens Gv29-8]
MTLASLSFFVGTSSAITTPLRLPASPGYQGRSNACPARCAVTGPNPANWSLYRNLNQFALCQESIFYSFSFLDPVDDADEVHRIYACTSFGPDWANLPANTSSLSSESAKAPVLVNGTYEIGSWPSAPGSIVSTSLATITTQIRHYLSNGFGAADHPTILFASFGSTSVGLYIGQGLQNRGIGNIALAYLENSIATSSASHSAQVAMQFCQPGQTSHHIFGLIATGNGTFAAVQDALKSWSKAECLTFPVVQNTTGTIPLGTPLFTPSTNITSNNSSLTHGSAASVRHGALTPRANCTTIQVVYGDTCGSLAQRCGITSAQFTQYNPASNECSSLQPGEHVCCSAGTLPNYAPPPQADGTCATYTVQPNDDCSTIAASYSLTVTELGNFNNNTWAWGGCSRPLYPNNIICISKGNPPMPAPVSNALCGPQVPGTPTPPSGTNISTLNPCPLNACCDVWGQCGTTADFCTNTGTGAPGTAAKGTNGCISNCGTNIVLSSPPSEYRSIGFYEGFNLQRSCLFQDVSQINVNAYTHIYFAFGVLTPSYVVQIPNATTLYEFNEFQRIVGAKRILSIGGWDFSTNPSTYNIFREGVTAANRLTMATNIAKFINDNDLDGVNIDWEYPGAPDIPGIPPASTSDGTNYLAFLAILRNLLPSKEITIAAPASYWYLQGFPIEKMAPLLDYIIYMTYDLHGQWDSQNAWSQLGCPTGNCLRTDVNLTETIGALVMITKAGVPSNKVVVGTTSYGRSFAMADAGCYGPDCTFLGSADDSQAAPGPCTQTAGYISNAEIQEILANSSRVNQNFIDAASNTNILVYDDIQWVGWMSNGIKASRAALYKGLAMGGTTDWATDLQEYNEPPYVVSNWGMLISDVLMGTDPFQEGTRHGNWTNLNCTDPAVQDALYMSCPQRWSRLDANDAWSDAIAIWNTSDSSRTTFSLSIMNTLHGPENVDCGLLPPKSNCDQTETCAVVQGTSTNGGSGMYSQFYAAINYASDTYIGDALTDFENTFAPVPPEEDDEWKLILTNLAGLGLTAIAAPFFDGVFGALPALVALGDAAADTVKDITYATLAFGAAIVTIVLDGGGEPLWTAKSQASFSDTMGAALGGWAAIVENQLAALFNGSEASIALLGTMIGNGNLLECDGSSPSQSDPSDNSTYTDIEKYVTRAFFGFAIPAIWTVSGAAAFVVDSGYPCGTVNPLGLYMSNDTAEATYSCHNGNLYYLVSVAGDYHSCTGEDIALTIDTVNPPPPPCTDSLFTAPVGLDSLGSKWGGITVSDLIAGSVNTYVANGNANGAPAANPADSQTIQDLANQDITTPGYITLPVCSPQVAWASWSNPSQSNATAPGYPCNPLQGVTKCSGYTYVDQTSSASPTVSDCQTIIKNIQGTNGEWTTGIGSQRNIASFGTCNFGVDNSGVTGDVTYYTGSQDIVNIITQSIALYGGGGQVGAKGYMECAGDAGSQYVEWGLY